MATSSSSSATKRSGGKDIDKMHIAPLGGGQEVGRSCILLTFKSRSIMLDCGLHPGIKKDDPIPFFDIIDDSADIDLILITHFHIDHCAALPYFTEKTNFRGRIFMTHATKAVMRLLLADNLKLQSWNKPLYTEADLQRCVDKCEVVDYHQTIEHKGIRFTATAAGHVLGAAMFTIEIDGIRVLYTGDYSLEEDRHLTQAEMPTGPAPDVLIVESTFGVTNLPSSEERELLFTNTVETIVARGGSCLIPVFALGRAQELLLILDDYWQASPHLKNIPVFYASKVASKALRVYQTFVNMMNKHIRSLMDVRNPFRLRHVQNMLRSDFDTVGPCVVMAAPGFLASGVSRHLFERWCDDERNGVIIAGYTIEGTLAHDLLSSPTEVVCLDGRIKPRRCQIEHVSFAAHVDFSQNARFIRSVVPDNIILVHGGKNGMRRLKDELDRDIGKNWPLSRNGQKVTVSMPENGQWVKLGFSKTISADVVGVAATNLLSNLDVLNANYEGNVPPGSVLVSENFVSKVVAADELSSYTSCKLGSITQRLLVPVPLGLDFKKSTANLMSLIAPHMEELFDSVVVIDGTVIQMHGQVSISAIKAESAASTPTLLVEWKASPLADLIADSAVGLILQLFSTPSVLRMSMSAGRRKCVAHKAAAGNEGSSSGTHAGSMEVAAESTSLKGRFSLSLAEERGSASKRLRTGEVDPSNAIPAAIASVNDVARQEARLRALQASLQLSEKASKKRVFASVELSRDLTKLIFRGEAPTKKSSMAVPEAYLFVLWGADGSDAHEAVVQSDSEEFRKAVIDRLAAI